MSENELVNKNSYLWHIPQFVGIALVIGASCFLYFVLNADLFACIESCMFSAIGISILGFAVRKFYPVPKDSLGESLQNLRIFWIVFMIGMVVSILSIFIPNAAWPLAAFYVLLSVFSSPMIGIVGGSVLILIAVALSGSGVGVFVLYLLCGILGVCAFLPIKGDIKLGRPMIVTLTGLLACEMVGIILTSKAQFLPDQFLLPGVNLVVTGIIIFAGLRFYALRIQYRLRDRYQLLNDTEYPLLAQARENDRRLYKQSIHTAYFCERIARELDMNIEAVKCAGYFHRFCPAQREERDAFYLNENIPGPVQGILDEYSDYISFKGKYKLKSREAAVLIISQTIISAALSLIEKDKDISVSSQIDKLINSAFDRFDRVDLFAESDVTYKDMRIMKAIFKEDKLYYDFLY